MFFTELALSALEMALLSFVTGFFVMSGVVLTVFLAAKYLFDIVDGDGVIGH